MTDDDNLISDIMPSTSESYQPEDDGEDYRTEDEKADERAEQDERHMMRTAGLGLTEELIKWFDNEVKATDSVKAAMAYAAENGLEGNIPDVLRAFDIVRAVLEIKRDNLVALKEEHLS